MTRQELNTMMRSNCVSFALKSQIERAAQRDCLDALRDAETLLEVCKLLCREAGLPA